MERQTTLVRQAMFFVRAYLLAVFSSRWHDSYLLQNSLFIAPWPFTSNVCHVLHITIQNVTVYKKKCSVVLELLPIKPCCCLYRLLNQKKYTLSVTEHFRALHTMDHEHPLRNTPQFGFSNILITISTQYYNQW